MNNFDESQKEALEALVEGGAEVSFVSYNPNTLQPGADPEGDAVADGWVEYYREDADDLVEVIYTR